jgi:hypothetical protein
MHAGSSRTRKAAAKTSGTAMIAVRANFSNCSIEIPLNAMARKTIIGMWMT